MRKYDVYSYSGEKRLGAFLNLETVDGEVKIWYLSVSGIINWGTREKVFLSEVKKYILPMPG